MVHENLTPAPTPDELLPDEDLLGWVCRRFAIEPPTREERDELERWAQEALRRSVVSPKRLALKLAEAEAKGALDWLASSLAEGRVEAVLEYLRREHPEVAAFQGEGAAYRAAVAVLRDSDDRLRRAASEYAPFTPEGNDARSRARVREAEHLAELVRLAVAYASATAEEAARRRAFFGEADLSRVLDTVSPEELALLLRPERDDAKPMTAAQRKKRERARKKIRRELERLQAEAVT